MQLFIEKNPTTSADSLNSFLSNVAKTDRRNWTAIWDAVERSQRVNVLRWVKRNMVECLEGYEELALSVHSSFSNDSNPLIIAELNTAEYRVAIRDRARKGLSTRLEKERYDRHIEENWGVDWKEHAQPCLFPMSCCSTMLTCPRLRP